MHHIERLGVRCAACCLVCSADPKNVVHKWHLYPATSTKGWRWGIAESKGLKQWLSQHNSLSGQQSTPQHRPVKKPERT